MSVDIEIRQGGLLKKSLDLNFLRSICENYSFSYGISNHAFALDDYKGGKDIAGVTFIVYNGKKIGRGFNFWLDATKKNCLLRLNNPCADGDVKDFYDFLHTICEVLKAKTFLQDGDVKSVDDIAQICKDITMWNRTVLREQLAGNYAEWCLFGAVYPIYLEDEFMNQVKAADDNEAMDIYAKYFHEKQSKDYYYAKPIMYEDDKGTVFGMYAITEGVRSIFPINPYITMGLGLDVNMKVGSWSVSLGIVDEGKYETMGKVSFDDFVNNLNLSESTNRFDGKHIIIELSKRDIDMLIEKSAKTE